MTDARSITRALGGKWYGRHGRACCPACGDANTNNPSLSIKQGGNRALLLWCFKGCAFSDILSSLRGLGIVAGQGTLRPPGREDILRQKAEDEAEAVKRAAQAARCWHETHPIHGTVAAHYLRDRGLTCDLPDTLRFHPDCWHASGKRFPALVALVDGCDRVAVHRTYLLEDGSGKASVAPNKAMLGSVRGGAVRLAGGKGPLVVAEGIETALSLSCGLLERCGSVWAALSASGMAALRLPHQPGELVIASDGDAAGREAAFSLAERANALGWAVSTVDPGDGLDFNDILQREMAE